MGWRDRDYAKLTGDELDAMLTTESSRGEPRHSSIFERPLRWWEAVLFVLILAALFVAIVTWRDWASNAAAIGLVRFP